MKKWEADIAVISAGTAGLAAAVTAAEGGSSVIVLEKMGTTGGTANRGSGLFAVESRLQRLKQLSLTREEAFKIYMDFTHWRVNARLVRAFIDKSASTIDWLESLGVEFMDIGSHGVGNYYTWHIVTGPPAGPGQPGHAATMMKILARRAKELGVALHLKTPAKSLVKGDDRITGVIATDEQSREIEISAKAIIIATGGYGGGFPGLPSLTGDGIRMAREVGAATVDPMKEIQQRSPAGGRPPADTFYATMFSFQQPNLVVNLLGERFMNEEIMVTSPFSGNAISAQKNGVAFSIFDEATKDYYVSEGWDFHGAGVQFPITKATGFDDEIAQIIKRGSGNTFVANSVEELAVSIGIDPDSLQWTVAEYNLACQTGRDEIFSKNPRYLRPVRQPRFYASKIIGRGATGYEGIKINHKTEVLTEDYTVIKGIYAAGMDAAFNIYHDTYPNILPATAMGFAINSGRMAAENALEYIKNS